MNDVNDATGLHGMTWNFGFQMITCACVNELKYLFNLCYWKDSLWLIRKKLIVPETVFQFSKLFPTNVAERKRFSWQSRMKEISPVRNVWNLIFFWFGAMDLEYLWLFDMHVIWLKTVESPSTHWLMIQFSRNWLIAFWLS